MNLKDYYWYFSEAVPSKFCDDLIKFAKTQKEEIGSIDTIKEDKLRTDESLKNEVFQKRKSNVVWLNEKWIYDMVTPFIHSANINSGWNYNWDWCETAQFTIYKEGQHYNWHSDAFPNVYSEEKGENFKGKIRKLSVTLSLNDPSEYEGGELEFDPRNYDPDKREERHIMNCKEILKKGSAVVFPSHVWHRVKPVTKGTRYSLVIWCLGKPFV